MSLFAFQFYCHCCILCGVVIFVGHSSLRVAVLHFEFPTLVVWGQVQLCGAERSLVRFTDCLEVFHV